ncbi:MAG: hypothetical protein J6B68_02980 [Lachnospiraceae bacterium]|nr:hypothetical protein [Lachnospiraceae bacterium]
MYYIIGTEKQYTDYQGELKHVLSEEVLASLHEKVKILDSNYGDSRDLEKDLGGYCVVFPTRTDWKEAYQEILNKHHIQKELYEYREQLTGGENCWIEELYIISSDYGIVLFYPKQTERGEG